MSRTIQIGDRVHFQELSKNYLIRRIDTGKNWIYLSENWEDPEKNWSLLYPDKGRWKVWRSSVDYTINFLPADDRIYILCTNNDPEDPQGWECYPYNNFSELIKDAESSFWHGDAFSIYIGRMDIPGWDYNLNAPQLENILGEINQIHPNEILHDQKESVEKAEKLWEEFNALNLNLPSFQTQLEPFSENYQDELISRDHDA